MEFMSVDFYEALGDEIPVKNIENESRPAIKEIRLSQVFVELEDICNSTNCENFDLDLEALDELDCILGNKEVEKLCSVDEVREIECLDLETGKFLEDEHVSPEIIFHNTTLVSEVQKQPAQEQILANASNVSADVPRPKDHLGQNTVVSFHYKPIKRPRGRPPKNTLCLLDVFEKKEEANVSRRMFNGISKLKRGR
ncbi:unnamed protein product, partial [Allacma fusca]